MISVFVGCEGANCGKSTTTRSTRKLPIPASLVYWVHKMVTFGTLVEFLVATVQNGVIEDNRQPEFCRLCGRLRGQKLSCRIVVSIRLSARWLMELVVEMDMSKFSWTLGIRLQPLALSRHTAVHVLTLPICSSEIFVQISASPQWWCSGSSARPSKANSAWG